MLRIFKSKKVQNVLSPLQGETVALEDVPDQVFSQKILGDGIAVIPENGVVYSPVDGVIDNIADSLHAIGILTDDQMELIVHFGLDTVKLKGRGFTLFVNPGDRVKAREKLMVADFELLKEEKLPLYTPVVITNMDQIELVESYAGKKVSPQDVLFSYRVR